MDDESRELLDRVRALIAERDTLRRDVDRLHRSWLEAGADAERFGRERDEARLLLARIARYESEDRAVTPGTTRLARACVEARRLLSLAEASDRGAR